MPAVGWGVTPGESWSLSAVRTSDSGSGARWVRSKLDMVRQSTRGSWGTYGSGGGGRLISRNPCAPRADKAPGGATGEPMGWRQACPPHGYQILVLCPSPGNGPNQRRMLLMKPTYQSHLGAWSVSFRRCCANVKS